MDTKGKFKNKCHSVYLYHSLDCDILNILRYPLAIGGDRATGRPQRSEADATNVVTLLAHGPYGRAEVFGALAAPELLQERLSWHLVFQLLGVLGHYKINFGTNSPYLPDYNVPKPSI